MSFLHLYSIEFEVEAINGLQAFIRLDILGISQHSDVHRNLEVVFLLANEGVISQGEVEAFVGINAVRWDRTKRKEYKYSISENRFLYVDF